MMKGKFGLRRHTDAEIFAHYGADCEKVMSYPRGTVFVENTLGLHKGQRVTKGSRYVLQLQKSVSPFGYPNSKVN